MKKPLHVVSAQRPISVLHDTPQLTAILSIEQVRALAKIEADLSVASCAINAALERIRSARLPIDACGMNAALMVCGQIGVGAGRWVAESQQASSNAIAMDAYHAQRRTA